MVEFCFHPGGSISSFSYQVESAYKFSMERFLGMDAHFSISESALSMKNHGSTVLILVNRSTYRNLGKYLTGFGSKSTRFS